MTGYSKKITITDYANLPENQDDDTILSGLVKKVTVEISYKDGDTIETVDLSTVISKMIKERSICKRKRSYINICNNLYYCYAYYCICNYSYNFIFL